MKRVVIWVLAIGVVAGTVLVGWDLVGWRMGAEPGPLRKVWRAYKWKRHPIYEARVQLSMVRAITDDELAAENQLLDERDLLLPIVRELELAKRWEAPDETAAMVRLAEASNLRRGSGELELQLYVHGSDQELVGKIITPLTERYVERKRAQAPAGGER